MSIVMQFTMCPEHHQLCYESESYIRTLRAMYCRLLVKFSVSMGSKIPLLNAFVWVPSRFKKAKSGMNKGETLRLRYCMDRQQKQ